MRPTDWDVFISYKQGDGDAVAGISKALTEAGLRVWIDRDNLRAGETFNKPISDAMEASTIILCLISARYQQSEYCMMEYRHALKRRLPVRMTPGLELCPEMLQNGETVPDDWSVAKIVEQVTARVQSELETTRSSRKYLSCNRKKEWEILKRPAATGKPRLILLPGDHFQGHDHLLERIRFFHELKDPCQFYHVEWTGRAGPATVEFRNVLVDALVPPKNAPSSLRWSGSVGELLQQRARHAQVVLLHKPADGELGAAPAEHSLCQYYRWLAEHPEVGTTPLVCVQPIYWKTWTNWIEYLAFWKRWRAELRVCKLMRELGKVLAGWQLEPLKSLQSITKADLEDYANDCRLPVKEFVAYTYDRRSVKTLDSIQMYRHSP